MKRLLLALLALPLPALTQEVEWTYPDAVEQAPVYTPYTLPQELSPAPVVVEQPVAPAAWKGEVRSVREGDRGESVRWLRRALAAKGYEVSPQGESFDGELTQAVRAFQADQGLAVDGVAGRDVFTALNGIVVDSVNADAWNNQVAIWNEQARSAGYSKLIVVNIASFTLKAFDTATGSQALESRVVVGGVRTRTPLMFTRVINLKFNPDWSPPRSIGGRYTRPGPHNPLGRIRFSTDNRMNIYLHDTNARSLFSKDYRALSHGCIRVDQWRELAAWISGQPVEWVDEKTPEGVYKTQYVDIEPVAVILAYSTVDTVGGDTIEAKDVYNLGAFDNSTLVISE